MENLIDCKGKEYEAIGIGKAANLANEKYGRLTALQRVKLAGQKTKEVYWLCQCSCGNKTVVSAQKLKKQCGTRSCGCLQKEYAKQLGASSASNLTGQIFNGIKFLQANPQYKIDNNITCKNAYWDCQCHCGKIFTANSGEILQGRIVSCGCLGNRKSNGEIIIEKILLDHNIKYVYDKGYFKDLKMPSGTVGRYDFILLNEKSEPYRIIEFDGNQHTSPTNTFSHSEEAWSQIQIRDKIKNDYALKHNIPLIRIPYNQLKNLSWEMLMSNQFLVT